MLFPTFALFSLLSLALSALAAPLARSSMHPRPHSGSSRHSIPAHPARALNLNLDLPAQSLARRASLASLAFPSIPIPFVKRASTTHKASKSKHAALKKTGTTSTTQAYHKSVLALAQRLTENATAQPIRPLAAAKKVAKHAARALLTPLSLANRSITHQQRGIRRRRAEFAPSVHQRAEVMIDDVMSF